MNFLVLCLDAGAELGFCVTGGGLYCCRYHGEK